MEKKHLNLQFGNSNFIIVMLTIYLWRGVKVTTGNKDLSLVIYFTKTKWIKQSGAMVFIFNFDKVLLKKLFPAINI